MVDSVSDAVVRRPFKHGGLVLGSGGVIPDKVGLFDQEVEEEASELQPNGDAEEDHGVPLLVRQKKLGEDTTQGDDDSSSTWKGEMELCVSTKTTLWTTALAEFVKAWFPSQKIKRSSWFPPISQLLCPSH